MGAESGNRAEDHGLHPVARAAKRVSCSCGHIGASDWLTEKTIAELDLPAEGVLILGIQRDGSYIGAPRPETETKPGDTLVLYGQRDRLKELSDRRTGDKQARGDAVEDHEETLEQQEQLIEQ